MHISDALNGKQVDWPEIFREILITKLRTIKEELFKDKTTGLKSMIGPPLTMILIAEGLLPVQQEVEAGVRPNPPPLSVLVRVVVLRITCVIPKLVVTWNVTTISMKYQLTWNHNF